VCSFAFCTCRWENSTRRINFFHNDIFFFAVSFNRLQPILILKQNHQSREKLFYASWIARQQLRTRPCISCQDLLTLRVAFSINKSHAVLENGSFQQKTLNMWWNWSWVWIHCRILLMKNAENEFFIKMNF
jgi:hypothetical protein